MSMSAAERERIRGLFAAYRATGDLAVRDELVAANLRLALHLARRYAHRGVSQDDLEQVASLGLLNAIDRFDPDRGLEFSSFATPTIVGELKRHFRDKGWAIRVPRRVQELHVRLGTLVGELTHQLGRSPTIEELAIAARASMEDVLEAMEAAQAYRSHSIDAPGRGSDEREQAPLGMDDLELSAAENRLLVDDLLGQLKPRDQLLIRLRFYEEMTQHEIAARLGISQMHVSRLLAKCLDDLRRRTDTTAS
ncbi:MAG: SigB/SigF/SigG family RNA polymerase sigma factor [Acidimicrobiales bacterium]|nr:SigB/SigF/SigG family RNA polymerase sigma factor [Acidimicrobiales bacterium]HRW36400.1 SigB/SigF/SigG family RNA polymerase sigma factor [Aquihabitans sp.]